MAEKISGAKTSAPSGGAMAGGASVPASLAADGGRLPRPSVLLDSPRVIVALTVQEILDEHIAKKLA